MSKLSVAEKIAAKLAEKSGTEAELAQKVLEKYGTVEAATALRGPERAEYLKALDTVYGDNAKRAADLGFGDKTYFHGSPNSEIKQFDSNMRSTGAGGTSEGYGSYFTSDPKAASNYATYSPRGVGHSGSVYPVKLKEGNYISESEGLKPSDRKVFEKIIKSADDWENNVINYGDENPQKSLKLAVDAAMRSGNKVDGLHEIANTMYNGDLNRWGKALDAEGIKGVYEPSKYRYDVKTVPNPENIRSTNAAFDPRFKDSPNILAAVPTAAGSIVGNILHKRPDMGLGTAFSQINEPLEVLNGPRNRAIEIASKALGRQLDISGGKVPGMAEQNANVLETIGQMAIPASQDLVMGPLGQTLGIAGRDTKAARTIAGKIKPTAAEVLEKTVGVPTRTAVVPTAEQVAGHGSVDVKNVVDFFNPPPDKLGKVTVMP